MRLLVVDDDAATREMIGIILRQCFPDVQVEEAANAQEALALAPSSFDLTILDGIMPGMDGPTLVERYRHCLSPILGLTSDFWMTMRFKQLGVPTLAKPFDIGGLGEAISRLVRDKACCTA